MPAGHRNTIRPISSASDFTVQIGQSSRQHMTPLNEQATQDEATFELNEQRQVIGQNVNHIDGYRHRQL